MFSVYSVCLLDISRERESSGISWVVTVICQDIVDSHILTSIQSLVNSTRVVTNYVSIEESTQNVLLLKK